MLSALLNSFPIEIESAGTMHYDAPLGQSVLLVPVVHHHREYAESVDFDDESGLVRWFLVYMWCSNMLRHMSFTHRDQRVMTAVYTQYAMAFANAAPDIIDRE